MKPTLVSLPHQPLRIGIDLGTTNSLAASFEGGKPVVLPNAIGERLTPSAVSIDDQGEIIVGAAAAAQAVLRPDTVATAFKRDMGTNRLYRLGPRQMNPQELSAVVLRTIREDVEAATGRPIDEAVVTVPAYFDEAQRRATQDAAAIAGLKVDRLLNEPTAAALAYGLHERHRELRIAVLDLGGGTFDVTILEIMEGVIEIRGCAGDTRLGGEDFVDALAWLALEESGNQGWRESPPMWAAVRGAAEGAKRRLSTVPTTALVLTEALASSGKPLSFSHEVTREAAERVWAPLLDRCRLPVSRALRDAGVAATAIDEVLLVGGATRMPCVSRLAAQLFGRVPLQTLPPDEAVAMGAAVQAALKAGDAAVADMVMTDIAPFSMGVATSARLGRQSMSGLFSPVIERGSVIPVSRSRLYVTASDYQTEINVEIFQGEHTLCRENRPLGSFKIGPLPPRPRGEISVDVRFSYDLNGLLEVEAQVVETGQRAAVLLEQTPGRLTAAQIAEAKAALDRLKFHPRDALPNTTALARAESLHVQTTGAARADLAQAMTDFRLALESQGATAIEETRAHLTALVRSMSRSDVTE